VGTPDTAAELIRQSAQALSSGGRSLAVLRSTFLSNLHDLCRDRPLQGSYLILFEALERWESSVGDDRNKTEDNSRPRLSDWLPTSPVIPEHDISTVANGTWVASATPHRPNPTCLARPIHFPSLLTLIGQLRMVMSDPVSRQSLSSCYRPRRGRA